MANKTEGQKLEAKVGYVGNELFVEVTKSVYELVEGVEGLNKTEDNGRYYLKPYVISHGQNRTIIENQLGKEFLRQLKEKMMIQTYGKDWNKDYVKAEASAESKTKLQGGKTNG